MANPTSPPSPPIDAARRLLTLSDIELPAVRIGGRDYGLRTQEHLSLNDHARLMRLGDRLQALGAQAMTEAVAGELASVLTQICREVLVGITDEVLETLGDWQKLQVATTFIQLLRSGLTPTPPAGATQTPPAASGISASSSPDSTIATDSALSNG